MLESVEYSRLNKRITLLANVLQDYHECSVMVTHNWGSKLKSLFILFQKMPPLKPILKTGIEEWVKWIVITASVFLLNGALYSLKYPQDFGIKLPYLGPIREMGPSQSELFPLAPLQPIKRQTIPIAGIIALALSPIFVLIELKFKLYNLVKTALYIAGGLVAMTQVSMVQPGSWLILGGILLLFNRNATTTKVLP